MEWTFAIYGAAVALLVALTRIGGRTSPPFHIARVLFAAWALANLANPAIEPWLDAAGFYFTLAIYSKYPRAWIAVVAWLFFLGIVANLFGGALHPYYRQVVLNGLFALQMAVVAAPGGLNVARRFRDWSVDRSGTRCGAAPASAMARKKGEG